MTVSGSASTARCRTSAAARSDLVAALKQIRVPNLRWPGGCFADDYHWREGIGPREKTPAPHQRTLGRRGG